MTRLMSVSHTEAQVRDRSKTETRRLGWRTVKVGDRLTLCRKVMGRRHACRYCIKGEPFCVHCDGTGYVTDPLVRICDVRVTDVYREPLFHIGPSDVVAEGFPDWTPERFVRFFCETFGVSASHPVTVIQWRYLDDGAPC